VHGCCWKLALQIKMYMQGADHTIFATGPLVPNYTTVQRCVMPPSSGRRISCTQSWSESHVMTDSQSVSQSVLVSSPFWESWPDYSLVWWLLRSLSSWDALSDERVGLSFVRSLSLYHTVMFVYNYLHWYIQRKIRTVCTRPLSVQE
jgi:hypothetical protein